MKKFFIATIFAVSGAFGIFQANNNNAQMSELQLENAELLAQGEIQAGSGYVSWECFGYYWVCSANPSDIGFTGSVVW